MEKEPLLPLGEPTLYFNPPATEGGKSGQTTTAQPKPVFLPSAKSDSVLGAPSSKRQSWGALLSIIVIMLMIIIGAFYTWGKRVAEQNQIPAGLAP